MAEGLSAFVGTAEQKARFIQVMLSTSVLKPLLPMYLRAGVAAAAENPDSIKAAWDKAGWLRAWEKEYQVSTAMLDMGHWVMVAVQHRMLCAIAQTSRCQQELHRSSYQCL